MAKEVYMAPFNSRFDIITMGSATVDVFMHTDPEQAELMNVHQHTDICYILGSKILVERIKFFVGGGGTNTAVAFSRLGLKTGYIGKIGNDDNGKTILECLRREGIEFLGEYGQDSGYSVILDSVEEDRTIFTYKGCNDELKYSEIKNLDAPWLYLSSMMKESFKTQQKVVQQAHKKGIKIAYNPSLYIVRNHNIHLLKMLTYIDILIFNKEEAQALVTDDTNNIFNLVYEIQKLGPKIVVITDGKNGAYCYNSHDETVYSVKPERVKIVETTGAGDAFASGFVAGMITGKSIEFSLKLGMLNAESVISHLGAKNILLKHHAFTMAERDRRQIFKKKL